MSNVGSWAYPFDPGLGKHRLQPRITSQLARGPVLPWIKFAAVFPDQMSGRGAVKPAGDEDRAARGAENAENPRASRPWLG